MAGMFQHSLRLVTADYIRLHLDGMCEAAASAQDTISSDEAFLAGAESRIGAYEFEFRETVQSYIDLIRTMIDARRKLSVLSRQDRIVIETMWAEIERLRGENERLSELVKRRQ
jgi:hypothetical protein